MTQQGQCDSSPFKENRAAPKLFRIRQPKVCYAVAQTSQTRDISEIAPLRARDVNKAADGSFPGLFLFFSSISHDLTAFHAGGCGSHDTMTDVALIAVDMPVDNLGHVRV